MLSSTISTLIGGTEPPSVPGDVGSPLAAFFLGFLVFVLGRGDATRGGGVGFRLDGGGGEGPLSLGEIL